MRDRESERDQKKNVATSHLLEVLIMLVDCVVCEMHANLRDILLCRFHVLGYSRLVRGYSVISAGIYILLCRHHILKEIVECDRECGGG